MEAAERETIISWNDADDKVNVFTCHKRIMTKMEKLGAKIKDKCVMDGKVRHVEYEIPKDRITIGLNAKRSITIDQKKHLERARGLLPRGKKLTSQNDAVATQSMACSGRRESDRGHTCTCHSEAKKPCSNRRNKSIQAS